MALSALATEAAPDLSMLQGRAGSDSSSAFQLSESLQLHDSERHRVLAEWNDTAAPFPSDRTVADLFEDQVALTPTAPALIWSEGTLSYSDLDGQANKIAWRLIAAGIGPGTLVGLALRRSPGFVASLLGVLKAGAAYVPLDPDYPASRLRFMVENAEPALVITARSISSEVHAGAARMAVEDAIEEESRPAPRAPDRVATLRPDDLAYVVFTSGSTGHPKGVMNTHRGLINRLAWLWRARPYAAGEVACHKTSPNFVDGTTELLGPLLQGVPVVLASQDDAVDPARLSALVRQHGVTRMTVVPSLLDVLLNYAADLRSLRLCISSGETLPRHVADRFIAALPSAQLLNLYGMSEANGDSLAAAVETGSDPVPIGRPIANTLVYILDPDLQPVPVGASGELYIGGVGLARGYLNRADLTAERFIRNPFGTGRLYRTGDLARWRKDGLIEYVGRTDNQVKLNGFRIELGEIEAALLRHPQIAEAIVVVCRDGDVVSGLAAYVVCRSGAEGTSGDLRTAIKTYLSETLPGYMRPQTISVIARLPRTPNGKIDRQALTRVRESPHKDVDVVQSEVGHRLAEIWRELLGVAPTSSEANFFELGGHSLLATRMLARVERSFGKRVPLIELLRAPTFGGLSKFLRDAEASLQDHQVIPIQPNGARPPTFAINNTGLFFPLANRLGPDQPFIALQRYDPEVPEAIEPRAFEDIAADYVRIIRRVRPKGPYVLLGLCARGVLAYEIAQQLRGQGEDIPLLVIIDAWAPGYTRRLPRLQGALAECSFRWQLFGAQLAMVPGGFGGKLRYFGQRLGEKLHLVTRPVEIEDWYHPHLVRARMTYRPKPYGGRVLVLRRQAQPTGRLLTADLGWSALLTGEYQIEVLPDPPHAGFRIGGTMLHLALFQEPSVGIMAEQIANALQYHPRKTRRSHA
jgi:amino acid adenylation domain-containing protein